ncbi:MAG TPA: ABC transporter permease [Gemmatimonadales bacterium]|nr:ABC transporter permease [Gemmatimonadales bacterium]
MRKVLAVIRREFVERVRTRMFWVMALLGPVFFGALIFLPILMSRASGVKKVAVVDGTTDSTGAQVVTALVATRAVFPTRVPAGSGVVDSLTREVGAKRLDGFLILTDALVDSGKAEYRASNVSAFATNAAIEGTLSLVANAVRLERAGVNPRVVAASHIRIDMDTKKISGTRTTGENAAQSFSLAYFMAIILYMSILLYGVNVMSSVLEEKTTRIVEVLISSLRPFQLMLGKLLGVGAVSLFQFLIWGVSARALISQRAKLFGPDSMQDAGQVFQMPSVSLETAFVFIAYFLGGFLLYSSMYAAVGAISSSEQEARQAQQPVNFMLIISFMAMFAILNDPGSQLAVTLSLIPFSAPIAMPVRWAAGNLPWQEVALSLGILAVTIIGVTWVAARIYRVGILMTGKRPSMKEMIRWVRAG